MKDGWRPGPEAGTILGIEVLLPNSMGRIWLEGAEGLHLLYGRNGSGKSTVLNALRSFFMGQSTSATVRCFMRLPDDVLDGPIGLVDIDQDATDLLMMVHASAQSSDMHDEREELMSDEYDGYVKDVVSDLLQVQQMLDEGQEPSWIEASYRTRAGDWIYHYLKEHPLTHEMRVGLQNVMAHKDRNNAWTEALALPWAKEFLIWSRGYSFIRELRPSLRALDIEQSDEWFHEFDSTDVEFWHPNLLNHGWEEFVRLALSLVFSYDAGLSALPYAEDLIEGQGDGGLPAAAIREVATSRLICLSRGPQSLDGRWVVAPAAMFSDDTPNLNQLWSETQDALRALFLRVNPHASASDRELAATYRLMRQSIYDIPNFVDAVVPSALLADFEQLDFLFAESGSPDHPYVSMNTLAYAVVLEDPLPGWPVVVDLDDPIDVDSWLTDRFAGLLGSGSEPPAVRDAFLTEVVAHLADSDDEPWAEVVREGFEQSSRPADVSPSSTLDSTSLLWSGPDSTALDAIAEFPQFDAFRDRVAAFGDLLPRFEIGIGGLRVEPNWWLPDWIAGKPVRLEALDQPSDTWVGVSDLSDAQRRLVAITIQIGEAREEAGTPWFFRVKIEDAYGIKREVPWWVDPELISYRTGPAAGAGSIALFGDEIDAGVHIAASKAIFRTLAEIPGIGFVSSHSPTALRTPLVRLVNVHRNDTGRIAITSPGLSDDVQEAALRLGIDLTDVLASMYLAVIVEGSHDAIVIEELLRGEDNTDRMLVIEGRGARSMTSIADARLLVDFCDLRLLIVLDNVANDRYQPILESLKNLSDQGVAVKKAIKESGLEGLQMDSTPEERTLNEILERGARRGILDRIDIHGLPARDIVELLPASSFGLEHDWPHYGKEFRSASGTSNFKTWLRDEYHVSISKKTIRKAVTGLDQMTAGLVALQEAVLVAAEMASRDRGLSVTE